MDELQDALQDGRELRGWEFRLPRRLEHRFREETDPRRNRQLRLWTTVGVLWVNVLVPMRVRDALLFSVTTMAIGDCINIASASLHHVAVAHPDVVAVTHLLVAISVLARWLAEQDQRRSFVLGLGVQMRADDLARSNARLLELSNTDPLTGLANRRHFELTLARACEEAAETGSGVAVMMIDIITSSSSTTPPGIWMAIAAWPSSPVRSAGRCARAAIWRRGWAGRNSSC